MTRSIYGSWSSCKIGGGGYFMNVVLCPTNPNRMYTYIDVGGLYRSNDGGQRWRMLHGSWPALPGTYEVRSVLVDPRDDRRVIAAVSGEMKPPIGVFVSDDAGETWRQTLTASFWGNGAYRWAGVVLARHPTDPDIVLTASVGGGVWRSSDNGLTWHMCGAEGLYPTDLRLDWANPDRVWLCSQSRQMVEHHSDHLRWPHGTYTWPGGLYRSDDGGLSWRKITKLSPSEILQDPVDPGRLYGIFEGAIHISPDAGETWRSFSEGLPERRSKPYASDDEFEALAAGFDFVLTASTRGTFYRLRAGDAIWRKVEREGVEGIYEGEEWFNHRRGFFGAALSSIVVDPRDANHWIFTDWYGLYQTWDAGKRWKLTMDGIEGTCLHALQQDPSNASVVHLSMADLGCFYSEDGGERFHHAEMAPDVKCVTLSPQRPTTVYAVAGHSHTANQVFISVDRARSYQRTAMCGLPNMEKHHCNTIAADPRNGDAVYLCVSGAVGPGAGGVYRSADCGGSWTWLGEGLPSGQEFFAHGIWQAGRELAIGADGAMLCISQNLSQVYRWDKPVGAWQQCDSGPGGRLNCVVACPSTPGRFFLAADAVYRSDDGGASWKPVLHRSAAHVAIDLVQATRVAAGTADGVAVSEDGGETWRTLDCQLPHRLHNTVCFAGERLIAGSIGCGAFWTAAAASVSAHR